MSLLGLAQTPAQFTPSPRVVATESDHPLSTFFHVLPSQRRYRCIKYKTSRYSKSFVPVAIRMLNAK